jgi:hypothetical protein
MSVIANSPTPPEAMIALADSANMENKSMLSTRGSLMMLATSIIASFARSAEIEMMMGPVFPKINSANFTLASACFAISRAWAFAKAARARCSAGVSSYFDRPIGESMHNT